MSIYNSINESIKNAYGKVCSKAEDTPHIYFKNKIDESVYDDYNIDMNNILEEFKDDSDRHILKKQWNLIDPEQYSYALSKFIKEGPELFRFSESVLDNWLRLIIENTKEIEAIGILDGRDELNGGCCIDHYLIAEEFPVEFDKEYAKYKKYSEKNGMGDAWARINAAMAALDDVGFYDWAVLPDGNLADTDNGVSGVMEVLEDLEEDSPISDKIIAINRCMDVFHRRSDWSSAFIKGGKASLDKIASDRRYMAANYEMESNESVETNESEKWLNDKAFENIRKKQQFNKFLSTLSFDGDGGQVFLGKDFFKTVIPSEFYSKQVSDARGNVDDYASGKNGITFDFTIYLKNTKGYGDKKAIDSLNFVMKNNATVDFGEFANNIAVVWNMNDKISGMLRITEPHMVAEIKRKRAEPYQQYRLEQGTLKF